VTSLNGTSRIPRGPDPSPPVEANLPDRSPRHRLRESLGRRSTECFLLAAGGSGLLAGAWDAALNHVRLFSSTYPLWILLALNGAIALATAVAAAFVPDPEVLLAEDPGTVRVPREEWESLQRRFRPVPQEVRRGDRGRPVPSLHGLGRVSSASGVPRSRGTLTTNGSWARSGTTTTRKPALATTLGREEALLELHCIADGALFASDNLGSDELAGLINDSSADLTRIADTLNTEIDEGESSSQLLIRLLRRHAIMRAPPIGGRITVASIGKLATRLNCLGPKGRLPPPRVSGISAQSKPA
jgi:hypothetical protein